MGKKNSLRMEFCRAATCRGQARAEKQPLESRTLKTSRIFQLVLAVTSTMEGDLARSEASEGSPKKKNGNKVLVLFHTHGLY